jgi:hypothetical protein
MLNKIGRALVLVAALTSLLAVMASAAGAANTWTTNKSIGTGTFTATAGSATLIGPTTGLVCVGGTATSTVAAADFTGATWNTAVSGTITLDGCKSGQTAYGVHCAYGLNLTGFSSPVTTSDLELHCNINLNTSTRCTLEGVIPASYNNTTSVLNIPAVPSGGGLTMTNGSGGGCFFGTGTGVTLTNLPFTVTSAYKPTFTFTP